MMIDAELQAENLFGRPYKEDGSFYPGLDHQESISQLKSLREVSIHESNTLQQGWWICFAFSHCEYLLVTPSKEVTTVFADIKNASAMDATSQLLESLTLIATYCSDATLADKLDYNRLNQLTARFLLLLCRDNRSKTK